MSGSALLLPDVEGAGEALLELAADFARAARFFAIFVVATSRCSCDMGDRLISKGCKLSSVGPEEDEMLSLMSKSNRMLAKSVLRDSPIGH